MPAQPVYEFRSVITTEAVLSRAIVAPASVVSICDSPAWSNKPNAESAETSGDGLGCVRGFRAAFLIEIGTILLAYGMWHWMHLAH